MVAPSNTFYIKRNDTAPAIEEYLRNADGTVVPLTGASVQFHMRDGTGTVKVNSPATIVDIPTGHVKYSWISTDTNAAGTFYLEWQVTLASGLIVTTPNYIDYPVQIAADIV